MLQNGHMFEICGTKKNIKGTILCVVGDTPALALVGGFKAGVGFADKKCRHCMANNDQIQTKVSFIYGTVYIKPFIWNFGIKNVMFICFTVK